MTSVEAWVGNTCSFHLPIVGRSRRPGRNPGHRHGLRARSSTFRRPETPGIARAIGSEDGGAKVERRQKDEAPDLRSKIRGSRGSTDAPQRRHMWSIITWKSHLSPRRITLRPRWHPPSPVKGPSIGNPPTFIGGARCTFVTWPNTEQDRCQCSRTARHVQRCSREHPAVDLWASGDDQTADLAPTDPILVRQDQPIATGTPLRLPHSAPASVDTRSLRSPRRSPQTRPRVA